MGPQTTVNIIDYGIGNLRSVRQAFIHEGVSARFVYDANEILNAERLVLPGVGAFGDGMTELRKRGLIDPIREYAKRGRSLLGICLGMQMMFESSEENPGVEGLGLFSGSCKKFAVSPGMKVPQIGWNRIEVTPNSRLLAGCDRAFVYFVHSYYACPTEQADIAARSEYTCPFTAAVEAGNLCGCQFHPEKSQDTGLMIIRNFIALN